MHAYIHLSRDGVGNLHAVDIKITRLNLIYIFQLRSVDSRCVADCLETTPTGSGRIGILRPVWNQDRKSVV